MVHLPNFSLVTIDVLNCSSGLNVVTVSLSCFLLLTCQVSALSYIIVIMCLISLGLLVLIPSLFTCWSSLQDNACLYCILYASLIFFSFTSFYVFVFVCVCLCVYVCLIFYGPCCLIIKAID